MLHTPIIIFKSVYYGTLQPLHEYAQAVSRHHTGSHVGRPGRTGLIPTKIAGQTDEMTGACLPDLVNCYFIK